MDPLVYDGSTASNMITVTSWSSSIAGILSKDALFIRPSLYCVDRIQCTSFKSPNIKLERSYPREKTTSANAFYVYGSGTSVRPLPEEANRYEFNRVGLKDGALLVEAEVSEDFESSRCLCMHWPFKVWFFDSGKEIANDLSTILLLSHQ